MVSRATPNLQLKEHVKANAGSWGLYRAAIELEPALVKAMSLFGTFLSAGDREGLHWYQRGHGRGGRQ